MHQILLTESQSDTFAPVKWCQFKQQQMTFFLISREIKTICGWLQALQAREPSEIERDKSQDHTPKQNMFQWTCDLKQLRLSNWSSKQEPVTKRKIFSFNPPLPVLLFNFQYENCHSMLLLSPVLLPFNANQRQQNKQEPESSHGFPWDTGDRSHYLHKRALGI